MSEEKIERLCTDMDFRLMELWNELPSEDLLTVEVVAAFMRAAYGRGYVDALEEVKRGEHGKLCRDNGYRVP